MRKSATVFCSSPRSDAERRLARDQRRTLLQPHWRSKRDPLSPTQAQKQLSFPAKNSPKPLSPSESEKLKLVLHALAAMLPPPRTTEKTKDVLEQSAAPAPESEPGPACEKKPGHGRNGASSYTGAQKVAVPHPQLHAGD